MLKVEEHYRRRLNEGHEMGESELDFHGLDQGQYGTRLRHDCVSRVVPACRGRAVCELGCGTGLFLETLARDNRLPSYYVGVDMLPEREEPLMDRLALTGVLGVFVEKPAEMAFPEMFPVPEVDVMLAIGLVGYWGLHSIRQVCALYDWMREHSRFGAITFPMIYEDVLGDKNLVRFVPVDITDALGTNKIESLEREFVIYW